MSGPFSPCPACAGPVRTSTLGGEVVRERCPHCFPRRPFFRAAVEATMPDHRRQIADALAKAFAIPAVLLREAEPMVEAQREMRRLGDEFMRRTLEPWAAKVEAGLAETPRETCSTCGRSERLYESVPECYGPRDSGCRFALRRVE